MSWKSVYKLLKTWQTEGSKCINKRPNQETEIWLKCKKKIIIIINQLIKIMQLSQKCKWETEKNP